MSHAHWTFQDLNLILYSTVFWLTLYLYEFFFFLCFLLLHISIFLLTATARHIKSVKQISLSPHPIPFILIPNQEGKIIHGALGSI